MAIQRVTFEVDTFELFDTLARGSGDNDLLVGARLVGVLLTGKANAADTLGLAYYGLTLGRVEKLMEDGSGKGEKKETKGAKRDRSEDGRAC